MNNPGTEQLQRWMNEVITTQGNMQFKLQKAGSLYHLDINDVVAETRDVSIYSRMHVYTSGYVMRLFECLSADFPVLQKFMGEEVFTHFANASLMWSPSTSYSLYDLGSTFIRFLEATRPKHIDENDEQSIYLDLPIEIARAERARSESLRAKGLEELAGSQSEISPEDILFSAHELAVSTPECLRLVQLSFPVKQLFEQLHHDEPYEVPYPLPTYLAVSRMNYRPSMLEINDWQYEFLVACQTPQPLTDAINQASAATNIPSATILAEMCIWLPILQSGGFVHIATSGIAGLFG